MKKHAWELEGLLALSEDEEAGQKLGVIKPLWFDTRTGWNKFLAEGIFSPDDS